jgi:hypothetical protein
MILVATIGRRRDKLEQLLAVLMPQTVPYSGAVQVRAYWNNGERPLAEIRQALVEHAAHHGARYVSFVDDDDMPDHDYVHRIMRALGSDPDYVGFRMQHYADGVPSKPTFHDLAYGRWYEDDDGYYRDVSHLNPIRTSLAMRADFRRTTPPEDVAWCDQMREVLATTPPESNVRQVVLPHDYVAYHYYSTGDSTWRPGSVRDEGAERLPVDHPNFAYIDEWAATWPQS